MAAVRLEVEKGQRQSEGMSATKYHGNAHPTVGSPVRLGTFGLERRAKQLLGLCRARLSR